GRGSGDGRKDRLLVSTEQMRQTLTRYGQAKATLDQATQRMDTAWTRLSGVWEGSSKAAFMAQWVLLQGNIRKSHMAIDRSIRGLERTVGLFEETESANTSRAEGLDPGTVPPLF
ncbi:MAG: WXG100 family type VII secretion target, partial [Atopobiaceae bacterium]|nr:WXG100 family type VII secretion target [Atopobiaceae bacterium]